MFIPRNGAERDRRRDVIAVLERVAFVAEEIDRRSRSIGGVDRSGK
jgi:hypothetical protein